jgi:hypothetical protein
MCGGESIDARIEAFLAKGVAAVQRLLDEAARAIPARRAARRLATARRRLEKMRHRVVAAGGRNTIGPACADAIVARLEDVRAAIASLAPS